MLADFYIPRLSNDMKIAVQKNHLGAQILYSSFSLLKTVDGTSCEAYILLRKLSECT